MGHLATASTNVLQSRVSLIYPHLGKTITIKTIMKEADMLGYTPMYVKSFKSKLPSKLVS